MNSILSDAQTASDTVSNIFDFNEENGNGHSPPPDLPCSRSEIETWGAVRETSPCTISQASSGVTSALLNGKFKAQTHQLPMPQVATVKAMKKQSSPTGIVRSRYASSVSRKEASPQRKEQRSKIPQNATSKSSPPKVQRMSRDSESSSKSSTNTTDSGLGSSSESDKLRSGETSPPKTGEKHSTPSDIVHKNDDDVSEVWLKEKRQLQDTKRKSCEFDLKFRTSYSSGSKPPLHEKPQKESFKEKRDSSITYGMARQKFAPYSRARTSYQNSSVKGTWDGSQKEDKSKLGETGIVRRRVAQLEKTPTVPAKHSMNEQKPPRKPIARPTSIEKTPILVRPKTENTVELSRSICRRLEYSEGKSSLLDALKDHKLENHLIELPTTAQDLLMVDSYEVKREKFLGNLPSATNVQVSSKVYEDGERKRVQDISECENTTKRLSEDSNGNLEEVPEKGATILPLPLPDASGKMFSPDGSETSFEILESGSVDLSPKEDNEDFLSQVVTGFAVTSTGAKHTKNSPSRVTPLKKCRQDSDLEERKLHAGSPTTQRGPSTTSDPQTPRSECQSDVSLKVMETSAESGRSGDSARTSEFGDRWTVSGKCTPTLSSTRGDVDQDFLIDDEISDQPGLTFGDELEASFFGDEDLFSDEISSPASHLLSKTGKIRSRSAFHVNALF